ncbi:MULTISPECIES: murein hydrolase activator EnvC family protein [Leisingera]|jgi:septal ring factor EnvC (AmiA/AmiB activator)|uniref:Membrane-bound metallopeptidase n=1 Tax=Leisingera aquaemixtae TaxID=1396826 RepID=A0A0P1HMX1_9RHOB|nr:MULTISPECIES: peptidoglycan DD-metalloendopeptidase family protein [Leisingera]QDI77813.1 peptidase M23 [Leisingera aquaemixtae]UWQ24489.1 peptidoglycan DD-metalloendopeptidase family protein [Leisingera aquaemixtae]UWQ37034.1 peptidoglycan DD-metalloendopeptidase family protein [Leisingera aquaemixtae]UWQ41123.1 peptidoglycan DD-metalloendopeptidase family protein [Leisingera aquaemixtae]UWQ45382.1 peptidoglycan DD-metalloendopeptidase family protein [Leisingera aquaemixtae]
MIRRAGLLLLGLLAAPLPAAANPASAAREAAAELEAASVQLQEAASSRDRVKALTSAVQAYEAGLAAMRDGLRRVARREAQLSAQLAARQEEVSGLLGIIQTIETSPPPVLMVHPSGPLGAARSAMMLAEVTPALHAKAQSLKTDLDEVQSLRLLQQNAARTLEEGLAGVQSARVQLSTAIADRTTLPKRFTADPVRTAILISSTETLSGFADGLAEIADGEIAESSADISDLRGTLPLPVEGLVLRGYGERDAAGIARPGLLIAARPRALVTAPAAATIRYRGPLLDLGNVVILEPQPETLFVLSGLAEVFGEAGQVIPEGTPVGLMSGENPGPDAILSTSGEGGGTDRTETLYIEVRMDNSPVDPETWFRTGKGG